MRKLLKNQLINPIEMKVFKVLLMATIISACSSTKLADSWKNPDYKVFNPKNILIVGVTPNLEVRKAFEFQLKNELNSRQINALQSTVVFEKSFQDSEQTESEIRVQVNKLLNAGYDTILVSTIKGVDYKESYSGESSKLDHRLRKFIGYYLVYQDAYFNQEYYNSYKVFHIETSLYNLKKDSDKSLVWSGTYDIVDPNNVEESINDYVKAVVKSLEKEELISKKTN
jgi:hypothetical protein